MEPGHTPTLLAVRRGGKENDSKTRRYNGRLSVALRARSGGNFDDGIGQSAHGAHKDFDDRAVELRVGAAFEFGESIGGSARLFVRAVAGDGVVSVGDGDRKSV